MAWADSQTTGVRVDMPVEDLPYMSLLVPRGLVDSGLPQAAQMMYVQLLNLCQRQLEEQYRAHLETVPKVSKMSRVLKSGTTATMLIDQTASNEATASSVLEGSVGAHRACAERQRPRHANRLPGERKWARDADHLRVRTKRGSPVDNGHGLVGFGLIGCQTTLARALGVDRHTLRRQLGVLVAAGWVELRSARDAAAGAEVAAGAVDGEGEVGRLLNSAGGVTLWVCLRHPELEARTAELVQVKRRMGRARYAGQAIMGEGLSVVVASREFTDNARPGFLCNPFSAESLEYDRLYEVRGERVAFEFNGPQHYGTTDVFPDEAEADRTQARDGIKQALSSKNGVHLITMTATELVFDKMLAKVEPLNGILPLRPLFRDDPVLQHVFDAAERYARRAERVEREQGESGARRRV
ncbi:MAG: hypothetical protein IMX01_09560 [Limnochordaceae bacterium]|nr:hypothetical protein [Limnochordaceae bacterium]